MPEQVNGFSKGVSDDEEIIYVHDEDGTIITAEVNRDGEWSVSAFVEGDQRQVQVATGLERARARGRRGGGRRHPGRSRTRR